jgi:hypothetical protein
MNTESVTDAEVFKTISGPAYLDFPERLNHVRDASARLLYLLFVPHCRSVGILLRPGVIPQDCLNSHRYRGDRILFNRFAHISEQCLFIGNNRNERPL